MAEKTDVNDKGNSSISSVEKNPACTEIRVENNCTEVMNLIFTGSLRNNAI